ncbi:hypothetical protein GXW77_19115, partial [Roseomonas alkaliterrae]|nr:hypothetical protein [Neoroseomonas alkaliterrae]
IAAAAAEAGALLLAERPPSLDLAGFDARRRRDMAALRAWLATEAPQAWPKPPSP